MTYPDPERTAAHNLHRRIERFVRQLDGRQPSLYESDRVSLAIDYLEDGTYRDGETAMMEAEMTATATFTQLVKMTPTSKPITASELRYRVATVRAAAGV